MKIEEEKEHELKEEKKKVEIISHGQLNTV